MNGTCLSGTSRMMPTPAGKPSAICLKDEAHSHLSGKLDLPLDVLRKGHHFLRQRVLRLSLLC